MKDNIKILVGLDGSNHSTWALIEAISIAKKFCGSIKAVTIYKKGQQEEAKKIQLKAKQLIESEKISCSFLAILGSNPSLALVETARNEKFNLIVVGSRGLSETESFIMGSVSRKVVSKASCNVLVVKK